METRSNTENQPHSAEFFGEYRDYWWNHDFLELMSQRLQLQQLNNILDVGCGVGHWGRVLSSVLSRSASLTGIDRESEWIKIAKEKAEAHNLSNRFNYLVGDANHLPYGDSTFDLITCQTLMIHLKEPKQVISEMLRVLKPGGRILLAEPNNLSGSIGFNSFSLSQPTDEYLKLMRFTYLCERGKHALGLGFNSIGDLLPGYMNELGVENISAYLNDKTSPMFSPYSSSEQNALVKQSQDWSEREMLGWDRKEAKSYYIAGGGTEEEFDILWQLSLDEARKANQAIREKTFHTAGGSLFYLISGTKSIN